MTVERDNSAGEPVSYSTRVPCRRCGRLYRLPVGAPPMPAGVGPCCQPELVERPLQLLEPAPVELVDDDRGAAVEPPAFADRLCEGCRERPAAGVLAPGSVALCVDCADEVLEHWCAWLDDPAHEWWPTDDPFASARHPVREWRSSIDDEGRVRL